MGSSASTDTWAQTYQQIKSKHDAAYQAIQQAITLEEQERPQDAIEQYKLGIHLIDQSLNIQVSCPETTDSTWGEACQMIQKLKRTRGEVLTRITCIQNSPDYIVRHCPPPPSYDEAMSMSSSPNSSVCGEVPRTYNELAAALQNLQIEPSGGATLEVILTVEYARLYFISPDGTVVSTSEPETLTISTIDCDSTATTPSNQCTSQAFIHVGDWVYPLLPGVSPCVRTEYGAFIVPDVNSPVPGSSVGIIIPENAYETVYDLLENILHGIVNTTTTEERRTRRNIRPVVPSQAEMPGSKVSGAILTGAYYISKGLIYGAEKASGLLNYGTPKLINHIAPAPEATQVNPKVTKGFKLAKTATNKAATATGFVADKVGLATSRLGQYLAPHVQKQGTKLLSSGFNLSEAEASSKVSGVLTVAAGAVEGFATVYRGLETSAGILGQNLKNNSVKIVKHKYGPAAGEISNETLETVGNVITIGHNAHVLRPRKIFKNIAKSTVSSMNVELDGPGVAGPSGINDLSRPSALPGLKSTASISSVEGEKHETGDKEKQKFLEQEQIVNAMIQNSNSVPEPDLDFNSDDLININWSSGTSTNNSIEKR